MINASGPAGMRRSERLFWAAGFALSLSTSAWAHPPYVENWKTATSFAAAVLVGALVTWSLRKQVRQFPDWLGILGLGLTAFLLCLLLGLFLSFASSM